MKVGVNPPVHEKPLLGFDPKQGADDAPEWLGRRRKLAQPAEQVKWRWLSEEATARQRYELFDAWHDIAMQILDKEGGSFRLMATYRKVINWKSGEIWATDYELASRSGFCSERTVSRDIAQHRKLGIIMVDKGWRRPGAKFLRCRTISLAIPDPVPSYVQVRDNQIHIATRGLSDDADHIATRGLEPIATRGLITIDTFEEGASRNDPA